MQSKSRTSRAWAAWFLTAVGGMLATGCTSPLTAVSLRDFLVDSTAVLQYERDGKSDGGSKKSGDDHLAVNAADGEEDGEDDGVAADDESAAVEEPIEDAIERSLDRLAKSRGFDQRARDLLIETLEKSNPNDWPVIIDSFAASLESSVGTGSSANGGGAVDRPSVASAIPSKPVGGLTIPVNARLPAAPTATVAAVIAEREEDDDPEPAEPSPEAKVSAAVHEIPCEPATGRSEEEIVAALEKALAEARRKAPLSVRRICFASRVRGWGSIDRVDEPRFEPGQNVLVYVELDNLVGDETAKGVATRVAATFRLVDPAGEVVEEWSFPEVEDLSESSRKDYFVRYFLTIPKRAAAGSCRLEGVFTDSVASKTAEAGLSLEIRAN